MRPSFHQGDGLQEAMPTFGALHGANLEYSPCLFNDLLDQFSFGNRQRERFFTVDVLCPRSIASTAIFVCQWSGVAIMTASMSFRSRIF